LISFINLLISRIDKILLLLLENLPS